MGIKIGIANKVGFKVQGTYNDEDGIKQPFDFKLICRRMEDKEFLDRMNAASNDETVTDFMIEIIEDWDNVRGPDNAKLDYTTDNWRSLCKMPGVARLAFDTYRAEVGVKAKN